jgi:hypothetical protein
MVLNRGTLRVDIGSDLLDYQRALELSSVFEGELITLRPRGKLHLPAPTISPTLMLDSNGVPLDILDFELDPSTHFSPPVPTLHPNLKEVTLGQGV